MGQDSCLLLVSTNKNNLKLLEQVFNKVGVKTVVASTLEQLDEKIKSFPKFNLALIDVAGFDASIWQRCQEMNKKDIPFLIISPRKSSKLMKDSIVYGASGVLFKPLIIKELVELVKGLMKEENE